jgi:hypothetical protein
MDNTLYVLIAANKRKTEYRVLNVDLQLSLSRYMLPFIKIKDPYSSN